jgi:hypothetical protein
MLTKNVLKRLRKRFEIVADPFENPFEMVSLGLDGIIILDTYENAQYEGAKNVILRDQAQSTLGRLYGISCRLHLKDTVVLMTHDLRSATLSFSDAEKILRQIEKNIKEF